MSGLKDKVVVITGSSTGIGAATAKEFAKYGAKLVINGRNKSSLEAVAEICLENGAAEVEHIIADLSKEDGVATLVKGTMDRFGTVHVLVNNAAEASVGGIMITKGDAAVMDATYNLLLRAPWRLCGFFVDELIKNKGNIVNVSAPSSILALPLATNLGVMKACLDHMTRCMATELGLQGVRVNTVSPGSTATDVLRTLNIPKELHQAINQAAANKVNVLEQKYLMPEDIAKSIVFLASDDANRVTGVRLPVDGGTELAHPAYDFAGSQSIPGLQQK